MWWWLGCGAFGNSAPDLVSINGQPITYLFGVPIGVPTLQGAVGADLPITLDIRDTEGDDVRVWFPRAPEGLSFAADDTAGVWRIPSDPPARYLQLEIVLDDQNEFDPRQSEYSVPLSISGLDTGDTAVMPPG